MKMLLMCLSMALPVTKSLAAMAALERPSAISPSTSRSRAVSRPIGSRRACWDISTATTLGSSTVPPAATCRTASTKVRTSATRSLSR